MIKYHQQTVKNEVDQVAVDNDVPCQFIGERMLVRVIGRRQSSDTGEITENEMDIDVKMVLLQLFELEVILGRSFQEMT